MTASLHGYSSTGHSRFGGLVFEIKRDKRLQYACRLHAT